MSQEPAERDDRDRLAAEYVLGVLDTAAREEARHLIASDPEFAERVSSWEERMASLGDDYQPEPPPAHLKSALEARLFPDAAAEGAADRTGFWNAIQFWRPLAIVTTLLFLLTTGFGVWNGVFLPPPSGNLVVALQPVDSPVSFVAVYNPGSDAVRLSPVSGEAEAGKDFELWLIEGDNPAVSLGVLPRTGSARIQVTPDLAGKLVAGTTLAVSLEPSGGSTTGAPTGPVVALGQAKSL